MERYIVRLLGGKNKRYTFGNVNIDDVNGKE